MDKTHEVQRQISGDGFLELDVEPDILHMVRQEKALNKVLQNVQQNTKTGAVKYSENKLRWRLLPLFLVKPVAKVLQYGASKYKSHNWRGLEPDDLLDAFNRHMVEHQEALHILWEKGNRPVSEDYALRSALQADKGNREVAIEDKYSFLFDYESGLPHIDHAITSLIMYRHQLVNGPIIELPEESKL